MAAGQRDRVPQGVWRDLDVLVPQLERQALERAQDAAERAERLLSERQQDGAAATVAPTAAEAGDGAPLEAQEAAQTDTDPPGETRRDQENLPLFPGI